MNHRHTWTKLAGIGLLAIGLAGCGGGGSSADPVADSAGGSAVVADSQTVVVNKSFTAAQFQQSGKVPHAH